MKTIIKYDMNYMKKTSKFLVIGILGIFLAGLSTITAKYFNQIMEYALRQEGIEITLPPSTVNEAYVQFFTNFTQIYFMVILFIGVAYFTHDLTKGHYPLIFSKPIKRRDYILSKSLIFSLTIVVSLVLASVFFVYYTYILFGTFDFTKFLFALTAFTVYILLIVHFALYFSTLFKNYLTPLVLSLAVFFLFSTLSIFDMGLFKYMPYQLMGYSMKIMSENIIPLDIWISIILSVGIIKLLIYLSIKRFSKRSLV
jgi:ABC-2 type transport system permease protein